MISNIEFLKRYKEIGSQLMHGLTARQLICGVGTKPLQAIHIA